MRDRPPPAAEDLVATALGRALRELDATGGPLLPTSMHRDAAGDRLVRYAADDLGSAVARARRSLEQVELDTWVLVWDGYLTADGVRTESLYAHLEVVGEPHAHLYAWRYERRPDGAVAAPEPRLYLGLDGRFSSPDRSHPEAPAPTAARRPRRRWWRRGRRGTDVTDAAGGGTDDGSRADHGDEADHGGDDGPPGPGGHRGGA